MATLPDPPELLRALDVVQAHIAQAQACAVNPGLGQRLGEMAGKLKQARAELAAEYPKAIARQQKELEDNKQWLTQARADLAQLQQQAAAAESAAANKPAKPETPPPKPVEETIDPNLGQRLRIELLERFGGVAHGKAGTVWPETRGTDQPRFTPKTPESQEYFKKKGTWQ